MNFTFPLALSCARIGVRQMTVAVLVLTGAILFALPLQAQTITLDTEEQAFLTLINNYRQQNGLAALQASVSLTTAAKWMSGDMAQKNYFSHTDSLGRDPFTRMRAFNYNYNTYMGENIAAGYSDAANTFAQWKNSSGHNANMLNPNYKVIGVGRVANASSAYRYYWTTDFGGYVDQVISSSGPPTPPPTTVSLLNPSFESGLANWTTTGYVYYTTSYVTNGTYAALLYANTSMPASILQWVTLTPGATYEVSADMRADTRVQPTLGVLWENLTNGASVTYTGAGTQQKVKVRFTVPTGTGKVGVYVKAVGTSSSYYWNVVDNLTLVKVS